ncbi:hypothetical protein Ancab_020159 [Ancistrocladus abbreviatus]
MYSGPVYPTFWLYRFFADVWMLFPKEEYIEWFQKAGFKDVQLKRIGPKWYSGVRHHGLIMGCSVTGVKPASRDSPLQEKLIDGQLIDAVFLSSSSSASLSLILEGAEYMVPCTAHGQSVHVSNL